MIEDEDRSRKSVEGIAIAERMHCRETTNQVFCLLQYPGPIWVLPANGPGLLKAYLGIETWTKEKRLSQAFVFMGEAQVTHQALRHMA